MCCSHVPNVLKPTERLPPSTLAATLRQTRIPLRATRPVHGQRHVPPGPRGSRAATHRHFCACVKVHGLGRVWTRFIHVHKVCALEDDTRSAREHKAPDALAFARLQDVARAHHVDAHHELLRTRRVGGRGRRRGDVEDNVHAGARRAHVCLIPKVPLDAARPCDAGVVQVKDCDVVLATVQQLLDDVLPEEARAACSRGARRVSVRLRRKRRLLWHAGRPRGGNGARGADDLMCTQCRQGRAVATAAHLSQARPPCSAVLRPCLLTRPATEGVVWYSAVTAEWRSRPPSAALPRSSSCERCPRGPTAGTRRSGTARRSTGMCKLLLSARGTDSAA